jgi:glycosyltransferase involved in cell wall biosynthesis
MKTIAIDVRPLIAGVGGVPEYTRQIITHLVRMRPDYFFIFFLNSFRSIPHESFFSAPNSSCVFLKCPSKLLNASFVACGLPHIDTLIQKRSKKRIDLFFAPNIDFFSFSGTVPVVVTFHDLTFDMYANCFSRKQRLWHALVNPGRILHTAEHCIAVSEQTKSDIIRRYTMPAHAIHAIPLGIDSTFFEEDTQYKNRAIPGVPDTYILTLGARDKRKNALHVVCAYAKSIQQVPAMKKWKLVVLGGSHPRAELRAAVKKYHISDSIIFLNSVSSMYRRMLFSRARAFVYSSFYEGFGFPPLEAMACSTPVISAAHSSLSEISCRGAYCIDPYRVSSLTRALIDCVLDERVRSVYIKKGKQCAQEYSWAVSAQKTAELFDRIIETNRYIHI